MDRLDELAELIIAAIENAPVPGGEEAGVRSAAVARLRTIHGQTKGQYKVSATARLAFLAAVLGLDGILADVESVNNAIIAFQGLAGDVGGFTLTEVPTKKGRYEWKKAAKRGLRNIMSKLKKS